MAVYTQYMHLKIPNTLPTNIINYTRKDNATPIKSIFIHEGLFQEVMILYCQYVVYSFFTVCTQNLALYSNETASSPKRKMIAAGLPELTVRDIPIITPTKKAVIILISSLFNIIINFNLIPY